MKIGIYVGSFNPPHLGHIKVVNYLLDNNYVDKIIIIPTPNYWHKQDLVSITDRTCMLKYYENDKIIIDQTHNHYLYTYELMHALQKEYNNDFLYLIIGFDNIINFDKWKNYQELLQYHIILINRNNIEIDKYLEKLGKEHFIVVNDYPFINISSSKIREDLNNEYLDQKVLNYIKKHHLYQK